MSGDELSARSLPLPMLRMPSDSPLRKNPPDREGLCKGLRAAVTPMHAFRAMQVARSVTGASRRGPKAGAGAL